MTIRRQLLLLFAGLVLVSIAAAVLIVREVGALARAQDRVEHAHLLVEAVQDALQHLIDSESGQAGFILTGEEAMLEPVRAARQDVFLDLGRAEAAAANAPWAGPLLARLHTLVSERLAVSEGIIDVRRVHGLETAAGLVRDAHGQLLLDEAREILEEVHGRELEELRVAQEQSRLARQTVLATTTAAGALSLLLVIAGTSLMARLVRRRLQTVERWAAQLSGGATPPRLDLGEDNESRDLARALNELAEHRLRAEAELRRTSAELHGVLDAAPLAIVTADAAGVVRTWNPAAEALFGWTAPEVRGQPIPTVPEEQRAAARGLWDGALAGVAKTGVETIRLRRDGTPIEVGLSIAPQRVSGNERAEGFVAVLEDIRRRKALEREQQRLLGVEQQSRRTLQAISHAAIAIADEALAEPGRIDRLVQVIAERAKAVSGARYAALGIGIDPARPFEPWASCGVSPEEATGVGRQPHPAGLLGWVARHGQAIRVDRLAEHPEHQGIPRGHPPLEAFLGVPIRYEGRSVGNLYLASGPGDPPFTEDHQRAAELLAAHAGVALENRRLFAALAQERRRLALLAEAGSRLARSLAITDTLQALADFVVPELAEGCALRLIEDGRTMRQVASAAADEGLLRALRAGDWACGAASVEACPCSAVLRTGDAAFLDLAAGEGNGHPELEVLRAAGASAVAMIALRGAERIHGCLLAVARAPRQLAGDRDLLVELGRRAGLAVEHAGMYERTRRAVQQREDLLAVVSHDLKNPLSAVGLAARVLLKHELPTAVHRAAESIKRSSARMERLVSDLLDAAAVESGRLSLAMKVVRLPELSAEVVDVLGPLAEEKGVRLEVALPPDVPPVACDPARIVQVLTNLISNAVKFTPPSGEVVLVAETGRAEVVIRIRDSGPGIPAPHVERIFERYFQVPGTRQRGQGLGLFIARAIVEAHGGRIWVDTAPGRGSTFSFALPLPVTAPRQEET